MDTKICKDCGKEKTLDKFSPNKRGKKTRRNDCKDCANMKKRQCIKKESQNLTRSYVRNMLLQLHNDDIRKGRKPKSSFQEPTERQITQFREHLYKKRQRRAIRKSLAAENKGLCSLCNEIKPLSQFYKHKLLHNKIQNICKACSIKKQNIYRKTEKGKITANKLEAKKREKLHSSYIKQCIRSRHPSIRHADIPQELVEAYRAKLQLKRMLRNLKTKGKIE